MSHNHEEEQEKLFQVGVKALITDKSGKYLVFDYGDWHRKDQERHWDIAGGRVKEGQTIAETLLREMEEETGITEIKKSEFFTAVPSNFKDMNIDGHMVGLILLIYKVQIAEDAEIRLSEEHSGYEWVSAKEAAERLAYKYPKEFTDLLA